MRRFIGSLVLLSLIPASWADTTRMRIEFSGSEAGENVYETQADGSFSSTTHLKVGAVSIDSVLKGHFSDGRLIDYTAEQENSAAGKVSILFKDGKLSVVRAGKTTVLPTKLGAEPYFGNLHPQITASALKSIKFSEKSPQLVKCFCPDAATFLSPRFTPQEIKSTAHGAAKLIVMTLQPVEATYGLDDSGRVVLMDVPAQKLRFVVEGWASLVNDPLAAFPELSQPVFKTKTEVGVKMHTRDGAVLVADVVRPDAPGKYPVILGRTPYGRGSSMGEGGFYASRGYAFVVQDCRGRGDRTGKWDPFMHERKDGADAVKWVANQPWSDGYVGMIGGSYGGFVQWAAAVESPSALKCIVPQVSPPDAMLNLPYDNGIFFLYGAVWWAKIVSGKTIDLSSFMSALPHPEKFATLPISKVDAAVLGKSSPFYLNWTKRDRKSLWTGFNYEDDLDKVHIPALNISGWWDGDEIGTMVNWERMRKLGRKNQWLIYGPWTHLFNTTTKIGETDFGKDSVIDLDSIYLRWFDTWLKHKNVFWDKQPHVRIFFTGSNRWVESADWPLKGSKKMSLYLSGTGDVQGDGSVGQLVAEPPSRQKPSSWIYDPHVAPITKEFLSPDPSEVSMQVEMPKKMPGLVVFKSQPMKTAISVSAPVSLDLHFSTSAFDTDFYVNISDIDEKGKYHAISQPGKVRCSYMKGLDKQIPLKPGKIYEVQIRVWDTAHTFLKGHRLALVLRSTEFPLFARNLGTVDPIVTATRIVVQKQKIYHDRAHPSSLSFQVSE